MKLGFIVSTNNQYPTCDCLELDDDGRLAKAPFIRFFLAQPSEEGYKYIRNYIWFENRPVDIPKNWICA